jgi:hypothetical protein
VTFSFRLSRSAQRAAPVPQLPRASAASSAADPSAAAPEVPPPLPPEAPAQKSRRQTLASRAREAFHSRLVRSKNRGSAESISSSSDHHDADAILRDPARSATAHPIELVALSAQAVQARRVEFPDRESATVRRSHSDEMLSSGCTRRQPGRLAPPTASPLAHKERAERAKEREEREHHQYLVRQMRGAEPPLPHFEHERQVLGNVRRMPMVSRFITPFTQTIRNTRGATGLGPEGAYATPAQQEAEFAQVNDLNQPMRAGRLRSLERRRNRQLDQLFPKTEPTRKHLPPPDIAFQRPARYNTTTHDRCDQDIQGEGCRNAVKTRFQVHGEVTAADVDSLTQALLDLPEDISLPKEKRYQHSVRLAANLRNVSNGNARTALQVLRAIYQPCEAVNVDFQTVQPNSSTDDAQPAISIMRSAAGLTRALSLDRMESEMKRLRLATKPAPNLREECPNAVDIFEHAQEQAWATPAVTERLGAHFQDLPSRGILMRVHALERSMAGTASGMRALFHLEGIQNQFTKGNVAELASTLNGLPKPPDVSLQDHHQHLLVLVDKLCNASEGDANKARFILQTMAPTATNSSEQESSDSSKEDNEHQHGVDRFKQLLTTTSFAADSLSYLDALESGLVQGANTRSPPSQSESEPPPALQLHPAARLGSQFEKGNIEALTQTLHDLPHWCVQPGELAQREEILKTLLEHLSRSEVTGSDANVAHQILQAIYIADGGNLHPPPEILSRVTGLKNSLAATATGQTALNYLENASNYADKLHEKSKRDQGYRHVLNICAELAKKPGGLPRGTAGNVDDFLKKAQQAPGIDQPIGQDNDLPLQLLHKALIYAQAKRQGAVTPAITEQHLPAYLAYCNGFLESGKGTELEEFLNLMNGQFRKYYNRTDMGPRTAGNVLRSLKTGVATAVWGAKKNPFTELTSGGVRSGVLGTSQQETAKFRAKLPEALAFLDNALDKRLEALEQNAPNEDDEKAKAVHLQEMQTCVTRKAMLALMGEKQSKSYRIDAYEVMKKVGQIAPDVNISKAVLHREIGKRVYHPRAAIMKFKMLEAWSLDIFKPTDPHLVHAPLRYLMDRSDAMDASMDPQNPPSQEMQNNFNYINAMIHIGQTRYIGSGHVLEKKDRLNAVQLRDLKQFVPKQLYHAFGMPKPLPRPGMTKELFSEILVEMSTKNNDVTLANSGHTVGLNLGNLNGTVGAKDSKIHAVLDWLTVVRPILKFNYANKAVVRTGDAAPGGEFTLGHRKTSEIALGLRVAVSPVPDGLFDEHLYANASAGAQVMGKHTWRERTMLMHTPIDVKGGHDTPDHLKDYQKRTGDMANFLVHLAEKRIDNNAPVAQPPPNEDRGKVPTNAQALQFLSEWFGDDQLLSFGMRNSHNTGGGIEGHAGLNARAGNKSVRVGPALGIDVGAVYERGREQNGGRFKNKVRSAQDRLLIRLRLDLVSVKTPIFAKTSVTDLSTTAVPVLGWMLEFNPSGNFTNSRVVRDENGIRHGMSFVTSHYPDATSLVKFLTSKLEGDKQWMRHLTTVPYNAVSENGEPIVPLNGQTQSSIEGEAVIRQFIKEALAYKPMGNCRFEERVAIRPEVADEVNLYEDELADLKKKPLHPKLADPMMTKAVKRQIQTLEEKRNHLVKDPRNWTVRWERVLETEVKGETIGLMFGFVKTSDKLVQATRKHKAVRGEDSYGIPEVLYTGNSPPVVAAETLVAQDLSATATGTEGEWASVLNPVHGSMYSDNSSPESDQDEESVVSLDYEESSFSISGVNPRTDAPSHLDEASLSGSEIDSDSENALPPEAAHAEASKKTWWKNRDESLDDLAVPDDAFPAQEWWVR